MKARIRIWRGWGRKGAERVLDTEKAFENEGAAIGFDHAKGRQIEDANYLRVDAMPENIRPDDLADDHHLIFKGAIEVPAGPQETGETEEDAEDAAEDKEAAGEAHNDIVGPPEESAEE